MSEPLGRESSQGKFPFRDTHFAVSSEKARAAAGAAGRARGFACLGHDGLASRSAKKKLGWKCKHTLKEPPGEPCVRLPGSFSASELADWGVAAERLGRTGGEREPEAEEAGEGDPKTAAGPGPAAGLGARPLRRRWPGDRELGGPVIFMTNLPHVKVVHKDPNLLSGAERGAVERISKDEELQGLSRSSAASVVRGERFGRRSRLVVAVVAVEAEAALPYVRERRIPKM
ncbi:unnamed protein product [Prorocentrum cordatum]|uniref:Uncharacterized protein n=1 Tax=Prorocentrum cordatum TaxID=2364126 RepID=A0ABN9VGW7_9DINO|nr:unnamed protein product [Polarella glacialis]